MARNARKKNSSLAERFDSIRSALLASGGRAGFIASILVLLTGAALLWWGVPRLKARMDDRIISASGGGGVEYASAPAWLDARRRAEISDRVTMAAGDGSVLDPHRLAKARAALLSTGWFRSVEQVRLADNGGFLVDATFVRPFAVIRHGEFDYLIDDEGRLLPMQWTAGHRPAQPHYLAIVGTGEPHRGEFGTVWPGHDVAAALELARVLVGRPWFEQVAAIDLSDFNRTEMLSLVTVNNGRVLWGRAPSDRSVAEVTPDSKLRTLDYLYASERRIDSGGGRTIDLRGDLVTVRASAAAPEAPAN